MVRIIDEKRNIRKKIFVVFTGSLLVTTGLKIMIQCMNNPDFFQSTPFQTIFIILFDWYTFILVSGIVFFWGCIEIYRKKREAIKGLELYTVLFI